MCYLSTDVVKLNKIDLTIIAHKPFKIVCDILIII